MDHTIEESSCRRMTNRWTVNSFMYILDVAAYNSFVLHRLRNPDLYQKDFNRQRRYNLESLAVQLIKLGIKSRIDKCSLNNFSGIRASILNAFIKTGESINKQNIMPNEKLLKEELCKFCAQENVRTRTNTACNNCQLAICRAKHSFIFCKNCSKKN